MIVGERLKAVRESKQLSQGDIEHKTGLLRCYISRVENGHTVPSVETLQKLCAAMEIPMHELFYEGAGKPPMPKMNLPEPHEGTPAIPKEFMKVLPKLSDRNRTTLLRVALAMAKKDRKSA